GGRSGPRGYHHGNLKEALIRAALELIAQRGPAGFTFAEAARWAGGSPAAPYRHFRDRDELLIDVARRGFAQFEAGLARAWDGGRPYPPWIAPPKPPSNPQKPTRPTILQCRRPASPLRQAPNGATQARARPSGWSTESPAGADDDTAHLGHVTW